MSSASRPAEFLSELPLAPETWQSLLEAVARGEQEIVVQTATGGRVALIAETRLARLRAGTTSRGGSAVTTLTPREKQILLLLEQGRSGAAVARELGVAANTVAQHLAATRRKLGVRTSADAVRTARADGMLGPESPNGTQRS